MGDEPKVPFEIKIDADLVNGLVAKAIMASAIGSKLQEIVTKAVADLSSYNSPLKSAIEGEVSRMIVDTVRTQYSEQIKAAIQKQVTQQVIDDVTDAAWRAFIEKTRRY